MSGPGRGGGGMEGWGREGGSDQASCGGANTWARRVVLLLTHSTAACHHVRVHKVSVAEASSFSSYGNEGNPESKQNKGKEISWSKLVATHILRKLERKRIKIEKTKN